MKTLSPKQLKQVQGGLILPGELAKHAISEGTKTVVVQPTNP